MRLFNGIAMVVGVAALAACPEVRDADDGGGGTGSSSGDTGTGTPTTGMQTGDTGQVDSTGPDPDSDSGSGSDTTSGMCQPTEEPAGLIPRPADILVLFSNLDSMDDEAALVQDELAGFFASLDDSLDPQMALLSSYPAAGPTGLCIDAPLGSGGCPTEDNNPPTFIHIDTPVDGSTALETVVDEAANWASIQREDAVTNIIVITDTDSDVSVMEFEPVFEPLVDDWVVHVSVPGQAPLPACNSGGICCDIAIEDGPAYRFHANNSHGIVHDMCTQDFGGFLDQVAQRMLEVSGDKCRWPAPAGDPALVNLLLQIDGGAQLVFSRSPDLASCSPAGSAWYFDDNDAPTTALLCPNTCNSVKTADDVIATFQVGCPSIEQ